MIAQRSSLRHLFIEIPGALTVAALLSGSVADFDLDPASAHRNAGIASLVPILARLPKLVHRNGGFGFGWPLRPALFLPGICARVGRVGVVDVSKAR